MHRCMLAVALVAGCGDNAADCAYAHAMTYQRNIWPLQLALDDAYVYYSDYNNDGYGTHVIWRQPRLGGDEIAIAARMPGHSFGAGMAVDDTQLYWTGEADPIGYAVFATPRLGGRTNQLAALQNSCMAVGVAVDANAVYAGTIRCDVLPSQVTAVYRDNTSAVIWESMVADVEDIAAHDGRIYIATTMGLVELDGASTMLVDGHPTHRLQVTADELLYSTDEGVFGRAHSGGSPRRLYVWKTSVAQPRAFALDERGLFVSEPPRILFVPSTSTEPVELVVDAGADVEYMVARGGAGYWATLALPNTLGLPNTLSGGVLRVSAPCE